VSALPNDRYDGVPHDGSEQDLLRAVRLDGGARAQAVNRTHRVVREQALEMRALRSRTRGLWVPVIISSSLLLIICYAVWGMMDGYDITPTGIPDASDQMMVLLLWSLPLTAFVLGLVWIRRGRNRGNPEVTR
jgi:hypothetical protein